MAKMQELVGRLTALDAEATETIKVIAYFDVLVAGHASTQVILRGAAILSGCAAGFSSDDAVLRIDASGVRALEPCTRDGWPSHSFGGGMAWIEREGSAHANDDMILERLAIALGIAWERISPAAATRRALQVIIDSESTPQARLEATHRLRLVPRTLYRVSATPEDTILSGPSVVLSTDFGSIRAGLQATEITEVVEPTERAGIGISTPPDALDRSWASALIALRLSSEREPVVNAEELGAMLLLADATDGRAHDSPDLIALEALVQSQPRAAAILESIADTDSLRAVAVEVGLHHSTVQAKAAGFADALGFDPRSPRGRVRLALALALRRLATNRFD
ncbi:hypothetical protein E3O11_09735 [Cryobacterium levicorallinum]|uniref:PucR C-terminal helix-turn-helix domain-containing protein n=2 Tax=Cryobacterium levicorallinum TaxID=995038 RepID=A0A4R8VN45_9MICO|nr:hypothetical protein [Cryobacterium levicorallinum]TFB84372.1 hypothetical protein E3O11_09735 [Cryobacterium levicorallinum]